MLAEFDQTAGIGVPVAEIGLDRIGDPTENGSIKLRLQGFAFARGCFSGVLLLFGWPGVDIFFDVTVVRFSRASTSSRWVSLAFVCIGRFSRWALLR